MKRLEKYPLSLVVALLMAVTLVGCADGLSTSSPEATESGDGIAKADSFRGAGVEARTRVGEAPVMTFALTSRGVTLEQTTAIEQSRTRLTVSAVSEQHGLALISETGRIMRLEDLSISESARRQLEDRRDPSYGWGETWREASQFVVDEVDDRSVDYQTRSGPEIGARVPVEAFAPTVDTGTWFVSEFGEDIVLMDAREVILDGQKIVDTYYYEDRLWLIDRLMEEFPNIPETSDDHSWAGHPHAGIDIQTQWQYDSGRGLPDTHGRGQGWWWGNNYTLSVWPVLIAKANYDVFEDTRILKPTGEKFAVDDESRTLWSNYFEYLRDTRRAHRQSAFSEDTLESKAREAQRLLWEAHMHSIRVGLERFRPLLSELPAAERKMASSWGETVVEYLAAVNFPTDELVTGFFNGKLPYRVLEGEHFHSPQNQLDGVQLVLLHTFWALHDFESDRGYPLLEKVNEKMATLRDWGLGEYAYEALREVLLAGHEDEIVDKLIEILD